MWKRGNGSSRWRPARACSQPGGAAAEPLNKTATTVGTGLIARGIAGYCPVNAATGRGRGRDDTRRALGGPKGVFLQESITIDASPQQLFELWRDPSNLPGLMPYLKRVDKIDDRRSHWVVEDRPGRSSNGTRRSSTRSRTR